MDHALSELGDYIANAMADAVVDVGIAGEELIVRVQRGHLLELLKFLRDDSNTQFRYLVDICGVDYPAEEERFEIVYNLLSVKQNQRVRIKVTTNEDIPVPSASALFSVANWYEREVWDLYGVFFNGHPDLRRLLTDYGFEGHPLRKDFPLTGYVEVRYDDLQKRVVNEPVKLTQEFRSFDFMSPWEGAHYVLPGDEKAEKQG